MTNVVLPVPPSPTKGFDQGRSRQAGAGREHGKVVITFLVSFATLQRGFDARDLTKDELECRHICGSGSFSHSVRGMWAGRCRGG